MNASRGSCRFVLSAMIMLVLTSALGFSAAPIQIVSAAAKSSKPPEFVLTPVGQPGPYFTLSVKPGKSKRLTVQLGNAGDEAVNARSFAADAYSLVNGGFGTRPDGDPVSGTTTWLDYPNETLDLAPKTTIERSFTVSVPKDAKPGQYIAALVLQTAEPITVSGSEMLRQTILKSIAVFITVPGAVTPMLAIGAATLNQSSGANFLEIGIENRGNVLLKPAGVVTLTTSAGEQAVTAPVAMGSVYAGMTTTLEIPLPASVIPGTYGIAVTLSDAATKAAASVTTLTVVIPGLSDNATPVAPPIVVEAVTLEPSRDATSGSLRFVTVHVTLSNTGEPLTNAKLTLHVSRDGKAIEDFPLNSSLVVPPGKTVIDQRYLPAESWTAGHYHFSVTLEAVNPQSGQTTVVGTADAPDDVTGP